MEKKGQHGIKNSSSTATAQARHNDRSVNPDSPGVESV